MTVFSAWNVLYYPNNTKTRRLYVINFCEPVCMNIRIMGGLRGTPLCAGLVELQRYLRVGKQLSRSAECVVKREIVHKALHEAGPRYALQQQCG